MYMNNERKISFFPHIFHSVQAIKVIRRTLATSVLSDSPQGYLHHPRGNYVINDQRFGSWLETNLKHLPKGL